MRRPATVAPAQKISETTASVRARGGTGAASVDASRKTSVRIRLYAMSATAMHASLT